MYLCALYVHVHIHRNDMYVYLFIAVCMVILYAAQLKHCIYSLYTCVSLLCEYNHRVQLIIKCLFYILPQFV